MGKKRPPRKAKRQAPPPKCKAILLCDRTIVEAGTGKVSVIGIFDKFALSQVPGRLPPFTAFVQLTDGIGRCRFTLQVEDLAEQTIVGRGNGPEIDWTDRLTRINLIIPVPAGIPLTHTGAYDFVVLADGQEIDRQQFGVDGPPALEQLEEEEPDNG